jgi:hypothetical protein
MLRLQNRRCGQVKEKPGRSARKARPAGVREFQRASAFSTARDAITLIIAAR